MNTVVAILVLLTVAFLLGFTRPIKALEWRAFPGFFHRSSGLRNCLRSFRIKLSNPQITRPTSSPRLAQVIQPPFRGESELLKLLSGLFHFLPENLQRAWLQGLQLKPAFRFLFFQLSHCMVRAIQPRAHFPMHDVPRRDYKHPG